MSTVLSALVLSLLALPPATPRLTIELTFAGLPVPAQLRHVAMKEVTEIWASYGVDVRLADGADASRDDHPIRLTVVLAHRQARRPAGEVLGSILFVGDSPEPMIHMYSDTIAELVSSVPLPACGACDWSPLHDLVVGRVFGRALAHEIGHFLLRSRAHSRTGLMRARHTAANLSQPDPSAFALSDADAIRLDAFLRR